jgi:hypothetical protein
MRDGVWGTQSGHAFPSPPDFSYVELDIINVRRTLNLIS